MPIDPNVPPEPVPPDNLEPFFDAAAHRANWQATEKMTLGLLEDYTGLAGRLLTVAASDDRLAIGEAPDLNGKAPANWRSKIGTAITANQTIDGSNVGIFTGATFECTNSSLITITVDAAVGQGFTAKFIRTDAEVDIAVTGGLTLLNPSEHTGIAPNGAVVLEVIGSKLYLFGYTE